MPSRIDPNKRQCSLLIFVATSAEEDALKAAAKARNLPFERIRDSVLGKYFWLGPVGNETVIAVRVKMGPLGRQGSAAQGFVFQRETGATGIVQLGMAFGIDPTTQKPGKVLVSTALIPYDNRDVRTDGKGGYTTDYSRADPQKARPALVDLFQREQGRGGHAFEIYIGALLSGAARVHCEAFRNELVRSVPASGSPIIGGEMEGVGLLGVSIPQDEDPAWCVVKGISDFGDEGRAAVILQNRPIACRNSAEFVLSALENDTRQR